MSFVHREIWQATKCIVNEYAKYICEYQDKSDLFKARFGKLCCFTMPCSLVTRFFFYVSKYVFIVSPVSHFVLIKNK